MGSPVAVYFLLFFALFCSFFCIQRPFFASFCSPPSLPHLPAIPCHVSAHVYGMCMLRCVASIDLTARSDRHLPHELSPSSHPARWSASSPAHVYRPLSHPVMRHTACMHTLLLLTCTAAGKQPASSQARAAAAVYIHTYIHNIHTYIHTYTHTYIHTYTHTHTHTHTYMHTCIHASLIRQSLRHRSPLA